MTTAGRPPHAPDEALRKQVESLASFGVTEADISKHLRMAPKTLRKHYRDELDSAHIKANAMVAQSLFNIATKGTGAGKVTACMFWLKTRAGWKESDPPNGVIVIQGRAAWVTEIFIDLPTLHPGQVRAYREYQSHRFLAVRCGRRWGKTELGKAIACDQAIKGHSVGWFAPEYRYIAEAYSELVLMLDPLIVASSKTEGIIRVKTGGRIDFWSLENERAGRSRRYHLVIIDEAAFAKNSTMLGTWEKAIRPTLLDYVGKALVTSNTNGIDAENFFWQICNEPRHGFFDFHAPTHANPYMPQEELAKLESDNQPLVYRQEYLAEFVDWSGDAFFSMSSLLVDGAPHMPLRRCDSVFATIDTATKTGRENDGTAVIYWARDSFGKTGKLIALDYDVRQIEGSLLEHWLPDVFQRLETLANENRARVGSLGAWIEDKASGMVLLQQAQRRNWPAHYIDSKLTALGKSERAMSVSGYVYRGDVKLSQTAYDKVSMYKGTTRNHLLSQVIGFRVGNKEQSDDDLLDCFCYGVAIALGNNKGF